MIDCQSYTARLAQLNIIHLKYMISTTTHWFLLSGNICLPHPCQCQILSGNTSFFTSSYCLILRCFSQADISILNTKSNMTTLPPLWAIFASREKFKLFHPHLYIKNILLHSQVSNFSIHVKKFEIWFQ